MIIPHFRKDFRKYHIFQWISPEMGWRRHGGNYHIINSTELSLAWYSRLHNYGKLFMGRCGVVGTWVASIMAEVSLEGAYEIMWSHLVQQTGRYLSPVGIHKHSFLRQFPPDMEGISEFESHFILSSLKTCSIFMMYLSSDLIDK